MSVAASAWCVICGEPPTATITTEANGVLAHYGSCWSHLGAVANRVRVEHERGAPEHVDRDADEAWPYPSGLAGPNGDIWAVIAVGELLARAELDAATIEDAPLDLELEP